MTRLRLESRSPPLLEVFQLHDLPRPRQPRPQLLLRVQQLQQPRPPPATTNHRSVLQESTNQRPVSQRPINHSSVSQFPINHRSVLSVSTNHSSVSRSSQPIRGEYYLTRLGSAAFSSDLGLRKSSKNSVQSLTCHHLRSGPLIVHRDLLVKHIFKTFNIWHYAT